jgi:hypothetical protein
MTNLSLGLFDIFGQAIPGSAYLLLLLYSSNRLNLFDPAHLAIAARAWMSMIARSVYLELAA